MEGKQSHDKRGEAALIMGHPGVPPVRGTQSLVHTLGRCWRRPGLVGLEVLWRWLYGAPAAWVVWVQLQKIMAAHTGGTMDAARLGLDRAFMADPVGSLAADPLGVSAKLSRAAGLLWPDILHVAMWLVPVLLAVWVVMSAVGRTVVLRRMDGALHTRLGTLMALQALRVVALGGSFLLWFRCIHWVADFAINGPIAAGQEPNLVLYAALTIVSTLGLFSAWAVVSWALAVAPLVAMLGGVGVVASLRAGFRLGELKSKLIEVNLVLGIVKIALIVLALVFSACPLPFEDVATPQFMIWWYAGVTVIYLIASDLFHVVHLVAYLELWKAYDPEHLPRRAS